MLTLLRPAKAVCLLGSAVNTGIIEVVTIITITRDKTWLGARGGQMRRAILWFVLIGIVAGLVSACGANQKSIFRKVDLENDESVITDAKQRIVTNVKVKGNQPFLGRINPSRIVCTEPSPDVAQAVSTAISALTSTPFQHPLTIPPETIYSVVC